MAFRTVAGTVQSRLTDHTLSALFSQRERLVAHLNAARKQQFAKQESLFGLKRERDFPCSNYDLPTGDQFYIASENAHYAWQPFVWNVLKTGNLDAMMTNPKLDTDDPDVSGYPSFQESFFHLEEEDFKFQKQGGEVTSINVLSPDGESLFLVSLERPINPSLVNLDAGLDIFYTGGPNVEVQYDFRQKSASSETRKAMNNLRGEFRRQTQLLYTMFVAGRGLEVMQIEVPADDDTFPAVFEDVNLFWKRVATPGELEVYLITHSDRGEKRIRKYLTLEDPSPSDYATLLGFPENMVYFLGDEGEDKFVESFDRYPSEEYALYLYDEGEISAEELPYYAICPYRVPPSKKNARYAIQLGKQLEQSVFEVGQLHDEVDGEKAFRMYRTQQFGGKLGGAKSVFPTMYWPLKGSEPEVERI